MNVILISVCYLWSSIISEDSIFFLVHSDSHSGPFEILGAANGGSSFDEADGSTPKEGTGTLMTLKSCGKQLHSNIPNRKTYIPKSRRGECEFVAPISE